MALSVKLCRLHVIGDKVKYLKLVGDVQKVRLQSKSYAQFGSFIFQKHLSVSSASGIGTGAKKLLWTAFGVAGAAGVGLIYAMENSVKAGDITLHPFNLPWPHTGAFSTFDISSVRRGFEVYKQVCSACHSLRFVHYRDLVDAFLTEEEAKTEAAEVMVVDGPDDEGKMFERPGKLYDKLPMPYKNNKEAAFKNNGAIPPDLSLITLARHGGEDYIFAILTGYQEAPAGVKLGAGQAYNPYFLGGALSMPQQLFDEMIEYADGTPATTSQMAKDVTTFLKWCAEPEHDTRKLWTLKMLLFAPMLSILLLYWKRHWWTITKTHKIAYRTLPGRQPPAPKG